MLKIAATIAATVFAVSVVISVAFANPPGYRQPIPAKAKYYVVAKTQVTVFHDKHNKHHVDEVFATNRPDVFKPGKRYKMVFTYHDDKGRLRVKSVTRKVLDQPRDLGGKPNLELCVFRGDTDTLDFVRDHLNMKTVKVFAL